MHKHLDGKMELVGYVTDQLAAEVSILDGQSIKQIVMYPFPTVFSNNVVFIPIERIIKSNNRDLRFENRYISVLDIQLK